MHLHDHTLARAADAPMTGTLRDATARTGISRTQLYRYASEGRLRLLKHGRTTLVDFRSLAALVESLPAATIRAPRKAAA